jgi:MFS family permease
MSVSSICTGAQVGTIVTMPACGALASSSIGWPSIFYIFGAVGILCGFLWIFFGADRPGTHKFISKAEQAYIETNLGSKVSTDTVCGNSRLCNTYMASTATMHQD